VIFNGVIRAPFKPLGNFRPPVPVFGVRDDQLTILLNAPFFSLNLRIEMVVPALSALLTDSPRKLLRDFTPTLWPEDADEFDNLRILLRRPRSLDELGVEHFLPPVQALHIRAVIAKVHGCDTRRNFIRVSQSVCPYEHFEKAEVRPRPKSKNF